MNKRTGSFQILERQLLGGHYQLSRCIGRYGDEVYFITDLENLDAFGLPKVIRQTPSREEAVAGLE
jgi:hypothetical protein